ncbi:heme-binding protein [Nonomuraea sp. B12E4]|uniref:heme-binding protein n=1 Tax=Nonomuraea sp. B12E4 TaxID=3153564 RepID=UPI00325D8E71
MALCPEDQGHLTFGGGIPITAGGHIIGGIGVCGGHWSDDIKIAEAGLAAIA